MNKKIETGLLFVLLLLTACNGVEDLLNPKHPPELDERGVVVSQDQVMPRDTIMASIQATNPIEGPMQFEWHSDGGSFIPPADNDTVFWIAPLKGGLYHIWVIVSNDDGKKESPKKQINVISSSEPVVNILKPADGSYFVVTQQIEVQVSAEHENGVALVRLYVNDKLQAETDQQQNGVYRFNLTVNEDMVGKTVLKAEAVARNQLSGTGTDQITIFVGGIIPGGNEQ
ncbi:MAG: hypothetical protein GXO77_09515 [Calditrichaeota bacterium]|nr:hypothetical protein [Calditrichota bacterium]